MVIVCASSIHLAISPALAAVVLLGINLAVALPSMPAGVGTFESGAVLVLLLSGVSKRGRSSLCAALPCRPGRARDVERAGRGMEGRVRLERLSTAESGPVGGTGQLSPVRSNSVA